MLQQYKILAFLALIVFSYTLGHYTGKHREIERQQQEILAAKVKQQEATVKTVTEYVDKIKVVKERGDVIVKKIPVYITKEIDNGCAIPDSFSLLWNASNSGEAPEILMRPATSITTFKIKQENVKLSDVILQHNVESTVCKQTEQQLKSLQDWVNEVVGK